VYFLLIGICLTWSRKQVKHNIFSLVSSPQNFGSVDIISIKSYFEILQLALGSFSQAGKSSGWNGNAATIA
jgi:hypothetical protein